MDFERKGGGAHGLCATNKTINLAFLVLHLHQDYKLGIQAKNITFLNYVECRVKWKNI